MSVVTSNTMQFRWYTSPARRAAALFKEAITLGMDAPSEQMVADAILSAESDMLNLHPDMPDNAAEMFYRRRLAGIDPFTLEDPDNAPEGGGDQ